MVSHKQSWGTHMEHSPEYVQSVGQKELFKYSMCWCRWIHNKVQELYEMWNLLLRFLNTFLALFGMSSNEYIEFLNNSFSATLCTYPGECSMCVRQDCLCDTIALVKMVWIDWFGYIRTTTSYYVAVSFGPWFVHIRLAHTRRNNISISWNLRYSWIRFCQYHLVQIWL